MLQLCITLLDILYVVLFVKPVWPLALAFSNIVQDIIGYPLDEIVFVSILVLQSIICARSFLMQLNSKPKDMEFRKLFYESLFGQQSQVFKSPLPILAIITVPISVWFIWTIVIYAYYNWEIEFAQFFHPLQLYPSVFLFFHAIFQGSFLLWFSLPSFSQKLKKQKTFASDIQEYINTNIVLLVHSICLIVIVTLNEMPVPNFKNLVAGEILYRIVALAAFWRMNESTLQPPGDHADQPPGYHVDQPPGDHTDQPPGDHADQPPGDHADQPPGDHANQPPEDHAPGDQADQPPGDHNDQTPEEQEVIIVVQSPKVLPSSGSKGNLDVHVSGDTPSSSTNSDNTSHSESTFPSAQSATSAE